MAELISLATMLTGAGSGVLIPFVNKLLGPSADELGVAIAEHARIYRLANAFKLFKKASQLATEAGFEPQQVSMKTLLPLLEGASLEDNSTLADKWAALLANAANPSNKVAIKPAYADILRQLTAEEAKVLDKIFGVVRKMNPAVSGIDISRAPLSNDEYWRALALDNAVPLRLFRHEYGPAVGEHHEFNAIADNLLRHRLLIAANKSELDRGGKGLSPTRHITSRLHAKPEMNKAYLSTLGFDFMLACSPPQKQ